MRRMALLFASATALVGAGPAPVTTVIAGGTIYDGSSTAPVTGDVVVSGDRIVAVGAGVGKTYRGARIIDARGLVVAPGFIDPHTHADAFVNGDTADKRLVAPWLMQGVSTIFVGNDGYGQGTGTAGALFAKLERNPTGPNVVAYVGFGAVREKVIGEVARAPDAAELTKMKSLVAQGMCEGAIGLSTGLYYAPQSFAKTDEVIAVTQEAAKRGGYYDTHQRDESTYSIGLLNSVREVIAIGHGAGIPVHISHIKALGVTAEGKSSEVIALIEEARKGGLDITANQYPYEASGTSLIASLVPRWAQDGGADALLKRIATPADHARIVAEMTDNLVKRNGAHSQLMRDAGQPWSGKRLDAIAAEWKVDAIEAALRIIVADKGRGTSSVSFNMAEADIKRFMQQPWVMTGSDGSSGHPRMYGTFPEKYAKYVVVEKTIGLADFINSSSGRTADTFKLDHRGHLKPGYFADVVVFDPKAYRPRSTYFEPELPAEGVRTLLVNGKLAVDGGKMTGTAAGIGLKHMPPAGTCS